MNNNIIRMPIDSLDPPKSSCCIEYCFSRRKNDILMHIKTKNYCTTTRIANMSHEFTIYFLNFFIKPLNMSIKKLYTY